MTNGSDGFNPKISIVTVTLNADKALEETARSVVCQTYKNIEFIIIDGGSSDNTLDVIKKYDNSIQHWVSEPDQGIYDAMNKGLDAATGDYVQFLNAGDYFVSSHSLESIIRAAQKHHDVIYGDIMLIDNNGESRRHHKAREFTLVQLKMRGTGVVCHQSMLVRKSAAPRYDAAYKYKGELNWYFDIWSRNRELKWFHFETPLVCYFLNGVGYQNFISNRLEWYRLLCSRFGLRALFNKQFLSFIYTDFQNRYPVLRRIDTNLRGIIYKTLGVKYK